jgi:SAM-dependent methyltransferase
VSSAALEGLLRCPACGKPLRLRNDEASCGEHVFAARERIMRLLRQPSPASSGERGADLATRTRRSFGYEWSRFSALRPEYRANFDWYMEPLGGLVLDGLLVLDAGCGMGRHTHHFLAAGAHVVALDASAAIDVAARNNTNDRALFVHGDILELPLASDAFDLVCCLGVLHHIEDTERGVASLVARVKPGGRLVVYLYHDLWEIAAWKGALVSVVSMARAITTRMPLGALRFMTWLLAAGLYAAYVGPLKLLAAASSRVRIHFPSLPLGQYADYPFGVLWNDQFDRLSAPLEKRFRRAAVESLLREAGLTDVRILGGFGWRAAGRRPADGEPAQR